MPAKTTIFNAKAQATHNFPLAPRNTILFSPHGRFVLVAGFGNLAGQMDIYDLEKNYTKVCTIEASNASVCEWSPDGTHILTATTSPRLRVDNGVRIWHVGGGVMYNEDMNELYHVTWRPQSTTIHPLPADPLNLVPTPHPSALEYLGKKKAPSKPVGAYRPPGARGTSTPLAFKREDEGGAAYTASNGIGSAGAAGGNINGFGKSRRFVPGADPVDQLPPGAAPGGGVSLTGTGEGADGEGLSKAALKNKKKREAKKAKEQAERETKLEIEGLENVPKGPRAMSRSPERRAGGNPHHERNRSGFEHGRSPHRRERATSASRQRGDSNANGPRGGQKAPNLKDVPSPALQMPGASATPPDVTVTSPGAGGEQGKKIRSLLKKIRAIEELKMRQAAGGKLEDTQIKKIATEDGVRKELETLGYVGCPGCSFSHLWYFYRHHHILEFMAANLT
jgi:translation initiation factor 2A